MILETKRLFIRNLEPKDLDDLAHLLADPEVMKFSSDGKAYSKDQTKHLLQEYIQEASNHKCGVCAIIHKAENIAQISLMGYPITPLGSITNHSLPCIIDHAKMTYGPPH
jgi:RimJ/RimL family protein N-acetyltransferase